MIARCYGFRYGGQLSANPRRKDRLELFFEGRGTAYVGTYTNPYVGGIKIVAQSGKLEIVEGPNDMRFTLEHRDGDTFIYKHYPELPDYPAIVKFTVGPNGVATALTNSAFEATGQDTLTRI
jgi:hypothetical protein